MKLGFDIDDTLIDLRRHGFHIYNRKLKQQVNEKLFEQLKTVEIHSLFGLSSEEGKKMWRDSMEEIYFTDCPIFEQAVETLHQLAEEGHEIYYITSRPKDCCEKTRHWMEQMGFPVVKERFYCGMEDYEKAEIINSLNLDVYVDDKIAVLETLSNSKTKAIVRDQSYNQQIILPRLYNWKSFFTLL